MKTLMGKRIQNGMVTDRDSVLRDVAEAQDAQDRCQILVQADVAKTQKDAHIGQSSVRLRVGGGRT